MLRLNRFSSVFFLFVVTFSLLATPLYATIINVPEDQPTIQAGINAATNGDTVLVQPGTYVENLYYSVRNIVLGSLFLTTQDTSYISQTVIDGNVANRAGIELGDAFLCLREFLLEGPRLG